MSERKPIRLNIGGKRYKGKVVEIIDEPEKPPVDPEPPEPPNTNRVGGRPTELVR